jgi:hypothetical protein
MSEFEMVAWLLFLVGVGLIVAYTRPWRQRRRRPF